MSYSERMEPGARIQTGILRQNRLLCPEHWLMTLEVEAFPTALPGQFVHLCPVDLLTRPPSAMEWDSESPPSPCEPASIPPVVIPPTANPGSASSHTGDHSTRGHRSAMDDPWCSGYPMPLIRRAFSVAGLARLPHACHVDVIYRVVGTGTRWMEQLKPGAALSVLGPLGHPFPDPGDRAAWLVAGGVGLPPLLWMARLLSAQGRSCTLFYGARSRDLIALPLESLPLTSAPEEPIRPLVLPGSDAHLVLATDDASAGVPGFIDGAMARYCDQNPDFGPASVRVYTCGPEPMMKAVSERCRERGLDCHVCMERSMACGMGTCQSCVVPVYDPSARDGWRYRLCCTDGPIFSAQHVRW